MIPALFPVSRKNGHAQGNQFSVRMKRLEEGTFRLVSAAGIGGRDHCKGDQQGKGEGRQGVSWMVRAVMEKLVIFHYGDGSRSGQTIRKLLKDFKGYLQSDGYSAYNVFEGTEGMCLENKS